MTFALKIVPGTKSLIVIYTIPIPQDTAPGQTPRCSPSLYWKYHVWILLEAADDELSFA